MFDPMHADQATTKTAIDWLLAHGEVNEGYEDTRNALATLMHSGVDYDACGAPQHTRVEVTSDEIGKVGRHIYAINAVIVAKAHPFIPGPPARFEFVIPEATFAHMVMGMAIGATPLRRGSFEPDWKARISESYYARLVGEAAQAEQREQARQIALAARVGAVVRATGTDPGDVSEYATVTAVQDDGRGYCVIWHGDVTARHADRDEIEFVDEADVPVTFTR